MNHPTSSSAPSSDRQPTPDEAAGIAWWNALSVAERTDWLHQTASGTAAEAWAAYKAQVPQAENTMDEERITITATMNPRVALQLAQLCKRIGFATVYGYTEAHLSQEERTSRAYQMLAGLDAVAAGLRNADFSPR